MTYKQLDKIADLCDPLFALLIIVIAAVTLRKAVWPFLIRTVLAVAVVQQLSKFAQKMLADSPGFGPRFPSTHFAVALALALSFVMLKPRLWPLSLAFLLGYSYLMVPVQHYHTPFEMLGALFAVPIVLLFHWKSRTVKTDAAPLVNN